MQENNFWKTDRGKALTKLLLWVVFIVIVLGAFIMQEKDNIDDYQMPSNEVTDEENQVNDNNFKKYSDMQDELLNNNYLYKYIITNSEEKIVFSGIKNGTNETGYKETKAGIIKYQIVDGIVSQINIDEITNIDNLYENIDRNYLDISLLFNNLSEYLYSTEKEDSKRTITYDKDGYKVSVITNLESIEKIEITVDEWIYELNFYNVNNISKIN